MPYVNLNGKLVEVTQEQFDIYTIGQNLNASTATVQTSVPNIAAGGTVTQSDSSTATILTPNTTNTSPGQTLEPVPVATTNSPAALDPNTNFNYEGDAGFVGPEIPTATAPGSFTPEQLNVIAAAQGVAGEEGNITADTLAREPGSYTAAELDAIAAAQGVDAGDVPADGKTEAQMYADEGAAQSAAASASIQNAVQTAQSQATIASQRRQINNGDWRVRLRLAPQANYLYNAPQPGILQPLRVTDGIIFPYTPQIDTNYRANYDPYDLTHSNYRGYFYKNSYIDQISLKATFTAQDTNEANYLLAVITFLKSATRMFYGQDAQKGTPPPVLYLTGLGDYQFKENPCVLSQFTYSLPDNVDYIRAQSPNNVGLNLLSIRDRQSVATNAIFGQLNRLAAAFLSPGAINQPPAPPTLGLNSPTYVPTKIDINLVLLPMQSRQQISKQFSLKGFASGDLIKGGFW